MLRQVNAFPSQQSPKCLLLMTLGEGAGLEIIAKFWGKLEKSDQRSHLQFNCWLQPLRWPRPLPQDNTIVRKHISRFLVPLPTTSCWSGSEQVPACFCHRLQTKGY